MSEQEAFPISKGLVKYIDDRTNSQFSMKPVADALALEFISDRNLTAFAGIVDDYYLSLGFELNEDASRFLRNFALRTYRHKKARSKAQVMISEEGTYHYALFVNDYEDSIGTETRDSLNLAERLKGQNPAHN